ncbi:transcriptional regulator, TetR family [Promicromonospora umidemergens]|uniref:HTH tetR-type domain-containing protein n=1 Tax=Promicromonospora umidemergens TaxID=629679 RepID=A0ABP8XPN9_9MICO|nr:TetR/AcrR family transcriptional regulator [Promicromonospora umidemergens]MCP2282021.1 transcriptional regulator, TetR family [Promicromonospora umidemergens]
MPRGFTTQERDRISRALLAAGRDLFVRQGLRKTALDELVAPAGIVKSTFYQFFDSKEALYLQLMLDEAGQVKAQVIDRALLSTDDAREGLRRFLHATLEVLETNPLWRRLVTHPEEMAAVAARLEPERIAAMGDSNPATALAAYVTDRQRHGDLVGDDPDVVVGALQSVLLMPFNAGHIAAGDAITYRKTLELLVDIVATGLTTHEGDRT